MPIYKITKTYRNAEDIYYVELDKMPDEDRLRSIAENTEGGHHYGYRIEAEWVRKLPKGARLLARTRTVEVY